MSCERCGGRCQGRKCKPCARMDRHEEELEYDYGWGEDDDD